jgi:multiple sugar transport system substrate-binding protein
MKSHRRTAAAAVAGALSLLLLAACSDSPKDKDAAASPVTIKVWAFVPKMEEAINLFNSTHKNIHVQFTRPADEGTMDQKLNAAVLAGSGAPDVVQVAYQHLNTFVTGGLLEDISHDASPLAKDFVPWTWTQSTIGGKVYAIPQDIGPMAMTYNKALFTKYHVPVPTTWAEYASAAAALHKADPSLYITALPANGGWFTSLAWQNGAQWFGTSKDAWNVNIDTPASQGVANYWQGLLDKKTVKVESDFSPEWNKDLNTGKLATWVTAAWGITTLQSAAPDQSGDWAVAPMPEWTAGKPAASNWGGSADSVVKGSKHAAEAVDFIHWLNTDPKSLAILTDPTKGGLFPASLKGQQLGTFRAPNPFFGGQVVSDVFADAAKVVNPSWVWGPTMDQVFNDLSDNIAKATSGNGTLDGALTSLQKSTVKAITDKGLSVNR